ncbi:PREDICTED: zinc finger protein 2-like [Vollenhovia emeryi]|uniref:zinc finger protein 2-like n=1 Tax=Vollenhovia emeryi TaxID=411798 RepID=UPI0005F541C3|nr:PREDICTED: zinc finger protein 2-like [Vollenhovia emeryi]
MLNATNFYLRKTWICYQCGLKVSEVWSISSYEFKDLDDSSNGSSSVTTDMYSPETSDSNERKLKCEICGNEYAWLSSLRRHQLQCVPRLIVKDIEQLTYTKKPVIYKCPRCSKSYQLETSLRRHQRLECGVEPKHECLLCGLLAQMLMQDNSEWSHRGASGSTYKMDSLRGERKKSTGDSKYECNRCGKSYKAMTSLSRHKRLECGVVPCEVCPICGRRFKHRFVLNAHIVGCERRMNQTIQKKDDD